MKLQAAWQPLAYEGLEQLNLEINDDAITAQSRLSWLDDSHRDRIINYELLCDPAWRARKISIEQDKGKNRLELSSTGNGSWTDSAGNLLPQLAGCIDIDFQATPFTNILPIRRVRSAVGERIAAKMVYITLPTLSYYAVDQYYTKIDATTWLFEQPIDNFVARITVDDNGLVTKYPGLFKRVRFK